MSGDLVSTRNEIIPSDVEESSHLDSDTPETVADVWKSTHDTITITIKRDAAAYMASMSWADVRLAEIRDACATELEATR